MVCGPLGEFVAKWAATTLPLLSIIGQTMTAAYVEKQGPVFSSRSFQDFTLVTSSARMVGGKAVYCVNNCSGGYSTTSEKRGRSRKKWNIACNACGWTASYVLPKDAEISEEDKDVITTVPGNNYHRTLFPVPRKVLQWSAPGTTTSAHTSSRTSANPSATSSAHPSPPTTPAALDSEVESNKASSTPKQRKPIAAMTIGEKVPRLPKTQLPKRARVDSLAPEDVVDRGEGTSKTVRRKRSRNCELSILFTDSLH